MASPSNVQSWDDECDVLICRYGCAGATAAIAAHDTNPSARILLIEKAPEEFAGSNARVSGQSLMISKDANDLAWSEDNRAEVESGLIKVADDIGSLALKIGLDPEVLVAEVDACNNACATGTDTQHARNPEVLLPISNGPFYAVLITPSIVCTGGGACRDLDGHVFNHQGDVIPRLFEAGELGSMFSDLYENGSYLTAAMVTGRGAARAALALEPAVLPAAAA